MVNKIYRTCLFPLILLAGLLVYSMLYPPFPAQAKTAHGWSQILQKQVSAWIEQLSQEDSAFDEWKKAKTTMQTLGAGQHQWLVHIVKGKKPVGYLVVGEIPDKSDDPQFALLEYGLGEYALFDPALAPTDDAQMVYDGLSSRWEYRGEGNQLQSVNAMTGERYPAGFTENGSILSTFDEDEMIVDRARLVQSKHFQLTAEDVDPFSQITWLTHKTDADDSSLTFAQLLDESDKARFILETSQYQGQVLSPYTVSAVHLWEGHIAYIGVWDEGLRFLPFAYAEKAGQFRQN